MIARAFIESGRLFRSGVVPRAWVVAGIVAGCSAHARAPRVPSYDVEFEAVSDTAAALAGVSAYLGPALLGMTDAVGRAHFRISGMEGQTIGFELKCPPGYLAPEGPSTLRLTRTRSIDVRSERPLKLDAVCEREYRDVAVVVHADQGGALPVTVDGQTATQASSDGYAQLVLKANRTSRSVTIGLDTSTQPLLAPKSPSRRFDLPPGDSILVYEQKFVKRRPAVVTPTTARKTRRIPYRLE